jgi:hypothetical protein
MAGVVVQGGNRADAAAALHSTAVLRALAAELDRRAVPVLVLKGPALQERLFGTAAAYRSGDVDVLIHARHLGAVRRHLAVTGWVFAEHNVLLWRLSRAAVFERRGVVLDLHWGIHAGNLPSLSLGRLERALWNGASLGQHGLFEPRSAPLLVYLAVHAASHHFEHGPWTASVAAAARQIEDWAEVWRTARWCRVEGTVRRALEIARDGRAPHSAPVLDGWRGRLAAGVSWAMRGHFVPRPVRASVARAVLRFHREPA